MLTTARILMTCAWAASSIGVLAQEAQQATIEHALGGYSAGVCLLRADSIWSTCQLIDHGDQAYAVMTYHSVADRRRLHIHRGKSPKDSKSVVALSEKGRVFSICRDLDLVWTPLSADELSALPGLVALRSDVAFPSNVRITGYPRLNMAGRDVHRLTTVWGSLSSIVHARTIVGSDFFLEETANPEIGVIESLHVRAGMSGGVVHVDGQADRGVLGMLIGGMPGLDSSWAIPASSIASALENRASGVEERTWPIGDWPAQAFARHLCSLPSAGPVIVPPMRGREESLGRPEFVCTSPSKLVVGRQGLGVSAALGTDKLLNASALSAPGLNLLLGAGGDYSSGASTKVMLGRSSYINGDVCTLAIPDPSDFRHYPAGNTLTFVEPDLGERPSESGVFFRLSVFDTVPTMGAMMFDFSGAGQKAEPELRPPGVRWGKGKGQHVAFIKDMINNRVARSLGTGVPSAYRSPETDHIFAATMKTGRVDVLGSELSADGETLAFVCSVELERPTSDGEAYARGRRPGRWVLFYFETKGINVCWEALALHIEGKTYPGMQPHVAKVALCLPVVSFLTTVTEMRGARDVSEAGLVRGGERSVQDPAGSIQQAMKKPLPKHPDHLDRWRNVGGIEFVYLAPGDFVMGTDPKLGKRVRAWGRGTPQHPVRLERGVWVGVSEVTQAQWRAVMSTSPWIVPPPPKPFPPTVSPALRVGDRYPAANVTWEEANAYCRALNKLDGVSYRLPSEPEWEYAARAGSDGLWCFGSDPEKLSGFAVVFDPSRADNAMVKVCDGKANAWGLHDVHGSLWEWCSEPYTGYPTGRAVDLFFRHTSIRNDPGLRELKVQKRGYQIARGGAWGNSQDRLVVSARAALDPPKKKWMSNLQVGFRLFISGEESPRRRSLPGALVPKEAERQARVLLLWTLAQVLVTESKSGEAVEALNELLELEPGHTGGRRLLQKLR